VPREQVFITTKILPRRGDPVAEDEDMAALDALDESGGTGVAQEHKWW
jgi:hypothetical protein